MSDAHHDEHCHRLRWRRFLNPPRYISDNTAYYIISLCQTTFDVHVVLISHLFRNDVPPNDLRNVPDLRRDGVS